MWLIIISNLQTGVNWISDLTSFSIPKFSAYIRLLAERSPEEHDQPNGNRELTKESKCYDWEISLK